MYRRIVIIAAFAALVLPATAPAKELDLAPLLQIEHSITRSLRRAVGPFFEWSESHEPERRLLAVRPLYSHYSDRSRDYFAMDILYPFWSYRRYGKRSFSLGLVSKGFNEDVDNPDSAWQNYLLPIYCVGKTKKGKNYFGIFPVAGVWREFFSYDYISFILFPLYMHSRKSGHIVSTHFLCPIFLKTDGDNVRKRRIFPFIGYNRQEGKWVNYFVLWPFINWGFSLNPDIKGHAYGFFPFFARMHYDHQKRNKWARNTSILWPFFKFARTNSGYDLHCPWPFYLNGKNMDGPNSSRLWYWPVWGRKRKGEEQETFWFWPLYFNYKRPTLYGTRHRRYIAIIWLRVVDYFEKTGKTNTFTRIWPFLSIDSKADGRKHVRILDMFPIRNLEVIERNFAPIWTLYQYRANPDRYRHDLLWGIWQYQKQRQGHTERHTLFPLYNYKRSADGNVRRLDFLTGLFGLAKSADGGRQIKLLWFIRIRRRGKEVNKEIEPPVPLERDLEPPPQSDIIRP